jgi:hypothetical protein
VQPAGTEREAVGRSVTVAGVSLGSHEVDAGVTVGIHRYERVVVLSESAAVGVDNELGVLVPVP